jgi:hypothetical protein
VLQVYLVSCPWIEWSVAKDPRLPDFLVDPTWPPGFRFADRADKQAAARPKFICQIVTSSAYATGTSSSPRRLLHYSLISGLRAFTASARAQWPQSRQLGTASPTALQSQPLPLTSPTPRPPRVEIAFPPSTRSHAAPQAPA